MLSRLITSGFPDAACVIRPVLPPYLRLRKKLMIVHGVYGPRMLVPPSPRRKVYAHLQTHANNGIPGMTIREQKSVFWPGITRDIAKVRKECRSCSEYSPS